MREKKWALMRALACPLFMAIALTGCSDSSDSPVDKPEQPTNPVSSTEGVSIESNLVDEAGNPQALVWQAGDAFQLFNDDEEGYVFTIKSGTGKSEATFESSVSLDAAVDAGMNKALYPAAVATKGENSGYKCVMLPYYGQTQSGNAAKNVLTDYMYMLADVQAGDPVKVDFKHLGAQLKFVLTLPEDFKGNVTKLELLLPPGANKFVDELCPSDAKLNKTTNRLALKLDNVTIGSDRKLTAYMMVPPVSLAYQDLTIGVTTDDAEVDYYYAELDAFTKSFEAGHQYLFERSLKAVTTKYAASSYTLADGGKTLSKWKKFTMAEERLDMTKDVKLRRVTKIASMAFVNAATESSYYHVAFKSIQLPDALTEMEDLAFIYLREPNRSIPVGVGSNLETLTGRVSVGSLMTWTVSRDNEHLHALENHLVDTKDMRLVKLATPSMGNGAVIIPDGIRELGAYSVDADGEIISLTLPMSTSALDLGALFFLHGLEELTIPQAEATSIGVNEYAFNDEIFKETKLIVPMGSKAAYEQHAIWGKFENLKMEEQAVFTMEIPYAAREPLMATKQGNLYTVEHEACDLPIELSSAKSWTAKTSADWITLSETSGTTATGPSLNIAENKSDEWRYATVSVSVPGMATQVMTIQQQPLNHVMPVVIHILKDGKSNTQMVNIGLARALVDSLNNRYKKMVYYANDGSLIKTFDTHIRLKLASVSPEGGATTGVKIHNVADAVRGSDELLGFEEEMTAQDLEDQAMLWPVNKYVNIFLTEFNEDDGAAGVSYLPFMRSDVNDQYLGYFWELRNGAYYYNLPCLQCLALDTKYLFDGESAMPEITSDFVNTAIHELGHYFGLHHTFDDGPAANGDDAVEDTPNYDRDLYNVHKDGIIEKYLAFRDGDRTVWETQNEMYDSIRELYWRIPYGSASEYSMFEHGNDAFMGTNIMDYFYRGPEVAGFTPGQVERMRFGIAHSPTLPNNDIFTRGEDTDTSFDPDFSIETKIMH